MAISDKEALEINLYINFVIMAVLGKMAEADAIYEDHSVEIRRVAARLRAQYQLKVPEVLYRGILVKKLPKGEYLPPHPRNEVPWISTTEEYGVACYFADADSSVSPPEEMNFDLGKVGVIAEIPGEVDRVLWCHRIRMIPLSDGTVLDLLALAQDALSQEHFMQFFHNATKQKEYILINRQDQPVKWHAYSGSPCPPLAELESKYGWPR